MVYFVYLFIDSRQYRNARFLNVIIIYTTNCPVQFALKESVQLIFILHGVTESSFILHRVKHVDS